MQENNDHFEDPAEEEQYNSCAQSAFEFKDEAIPFISLEPSTRDFKVNPEAIEMLKRIEGPLGVCSVAGMYRTGKSYLLNRMLLDRSNGFGVGPTINPCTKGLWIWARPVPGTSPDGEPLSVLVIDTEGLGAFDESQNHDVRIFTLAILLSSYFVYNSMGAIDENSLTQLSLVVNLSKNIQLKANQGASEADYEDISRIFPSFMWVVRDFSLQLIDQAHEKITSRDYFENALKEQKGMSETVESKNRIRRLIKTFFNERDCVTMIRPLAKEKELQNLANMELEQLRPDFIEQIKTLKRKVLNKIKPKMLNGKRLNGQILASLASQYVSSINKGGVPNIENAWTYICKNECLKALKSSMDLFQRTLNEQLELPLVFEELQERYQSAKQGAIAEFKNKTVGGPEAETLVKLKSDMKQAFKKVCETNDRECASMCNLFLIRDYQPIDQLLKNNQFETMAHFQASLREFSTYFEENGPPGSAAVKNLVLQEFMAKATLEASQHMLMSIKSEMQLKESMSKEKIKHLEERVNEVKNEQREKIEEMTAKAREADIQNAELVANEACLKQNIDMIKQEKEKELEELRQRFANEKRDFKDTIAQKESQLALKEQAANDAQRMLLEIQSETDKEMALKDQKMSFLERNIADKEQSESMITAELKQLQKKYQDSSRDIQAKHDQQLKDLSFAKDEALDKQHEIQSQLDSVDQKFSFDRQRWEDAQATLKEQLAQMAKKCKSLEDGAEQASGDKQTTIDELNAQLAEDKDKIANIEALAQLRLTQSKQGLQSEINRLEKEIAILRQDNELKDCQNTQMTSQLDERKQNLDTIMKAIESRVQDEASSKDEATRQLNQLRDQHFSEIQEMQNEFEETRVRLEKQVEQLNTDLNDRDLQMKLKVTELVKEIEDLKAQLEVSEAARAKAEDQLKSSDSNQVQILEEAQVRHRLAITSLEKQLEESAENSEKELVCLQNKAQEELSQLKNFYESEKERLEKRANEEKDRHLKKMQQTTEEFENRIRDEAVQHEDDIQILQDQLRESEQRILAEQNNMEYEMKTLMQKIDSLNVQLKEKEQRIVDDQENAQKQQEAQGERFLQERREMQGKMDHMSIQLTIKEKDLTQVGVRLEAALQEQQRKKKVSDEAKSQQLLEKQKLSDKIEELKEKFQAQSDEFLSRKLEDGREIALQKQKVDFQERKIEELQQAIEESIIRYEERMKQQKQDLQNELSETATRISQAKEQVEAKFESKRKAFKQAESGHYKKIITLEKEKAVLEQRLLNEQMSRQGDLCKMEHEIDNLKEQNVQIQEQLSIEREMLSSEIEKYKVQLIELEKEHCDLQNTSERDRALFEGKVQFLEQQREQAKADLQEASKKFETTLEQMSKRGAFEKDRAENSQNQLISSMELKFKKQLKEQTETNLKLVSESEDKIKGLEKQNREFSTQLQILERDRASAYKQLEKKTADLTNREIALKDEITQLRSERETRSSDFQKQMERDRETYKSKVQDAEQRCKDIETKRQKLMFELEKERAKWSMEKDQLASKNAEQMENVERLERRKDTLLRDNERLRNQTRKSHLLSNTFNNRATIGTSATAVKSSLPFGAVQTPSSSTFAPNNFKENGGAPVVQTTFARGMSLREIEEGNTRSGTAQTQKGLVSNTAHKEFTMPFQAKENLALRSTVTPRNAGSSSTFKTAVKKLNFESSRTQQQHGRKRSELNMTMNLTSLNKIRNNAAHTVQLDLIQTPIKPAELKVSPMRQSPLKQMPSKF